MYKKSLATTHLCSRTAVHAPRSCLLSVLRRLLCPSEQRLNLYTNSEFIRYIFYMRAYVMMNLAAVVDTYAYIKVHALDATTDILIKYVNHN